MDSDNQWASNMGGLDELGKIGNFTFKAFDSQAELDTYLEHEDYGITEEYAGVCFGFSMEQHAENKYELVIQMNDERPRWNVGMPNQEKRAYDSSAYMPDIDGYTKY